MSMADRCSVIYRGRLLAHWARDQLDRDKVGLAMGGASNGAEPQPAVAGGGRV
jgi:ABC-type sugar transport system ATPase subunit